MRHCYDHGFGCKKAGSQKTQPQSEAVHREGRFMNYAGVHAAEAIKWVGLTPPHLSMQCHEELQEPAF